MRHMDMYKVGIVSFETNGREYKETLQQVVCYHPMEVELIKEILKPFMQRQYDCRFDFCHKQVAMGEVRKWIDIVLGQYQKLPTCFKKEWMSLRGMPLYDKLCEKYLGESTLVEFHCATFCKGVSEITVDVWQQGDWVKSESSVDYGVFLYENEAEYYIAMPMFESIEKVKWEVKKVNAIQHMKNKDQISTQIARELLYQEKTRKKL